MEIVYRHKIFASYNPLRQRENPLEIIQLWQHSGPL